MEKQLPIRATHEVRQAAEFKMKHKMKSISLHWIRKAVLLEVRDLSQCLRQDCSSRTFTSIIYHWFPLTSFQYGQKYENKEQQETRTIYHLSRCKQIADTVLQGTEVFLYV